MTVDRLPDSPAGRPLAAGIGATQAAVGQVRDVDEPEVGYRVIARLPRAATERRACARRRRGRAPARLRR